MNILLTEESKRTRQRQNTISLQLTILAWSMEFITGGVNYLLFAVDDDEELYRIFLPLDVFLCSVMIPSCYVFKCDQIKKVITNEGWWKPLRDAFIRLKIAFQREAVSSNQSLEMNVLSNAKPKDIHPIEQDSNKYHIHTQHEGDDDENWLMRIDIFEED